MKRKETVVDGGATPTQKNADANILEVGIRSHRGTGEYTPW